MSEEQNKKYTVTQTGQVKNAEGQLVTNNPQPASRPWIKLWVGPWLDGTTRWQTTGEQRAFWLDLLAMSARCRFPGFVCAGQDAGQIVGYPLKWYGANQADGFDVLATLELFERTEKIRIIRTATEPLLLIAIEILNWNVYQPAMDDAERARLYRERQSQSQKKKEIEDRHEAVTDDSSDASRTEIEDRHDESHATVTQPTVPEVDLDLDLDLELELDSEAEAEAEAEAEESLRSRVAASATRIIQAFEMLHVYGGEIYGSPAFQLEWLAAVEDSRFHGGDVLAAFEDKQWEHFKARLPLAIERCIQSCNRKGIKPPGPFYEDAKHARHHSGRFNARER